ncbi:hypothetical protein F5887DRAFT_85617 [Amanita rubescens]|nr:hypothetical protein F5887DRAFT_85617 [Amanita rubescens]
MFCRKFCLFLVTVALSSFVAQAAPASCSDNGAANHTVAVANRASESTNGQDGFESNHKRFNHGGRNRGGRTSRTSASVAAKTQSASVTSAAATASSTVSSGNGKGGGNNSNTTSTVASGSGTGSGNNSNTTSTVASGNGNGSGNSSNTTSTGGSGSSGASTGNNGNSDPQTSLTLDPRVICTGFESNGQAVPAAGQVASLTSSDNFINFCLTSNLPLTNGSQVSGGSCNPAPMGLIPSVNNMPSAKFVFPPNFGTIQASTSFTIQMAIQGMETGFFVNAQQNYFSAPQQLNAQGQIQGHSHVVVEALSSLNQTTPTNPQKFTFFKGLNAAAQNGILTALVAGGLPVGVYKVSSINTAANHQPVLVPIAQHGSLDDVVYFSVTQDGNPASGSTGSTGSSSGSTTTGSTPGANNSTSSAVTSASASANTPAKSANASKTVAAAGATATGKNSGAGSGQKTSSSASSASTSTSTSTKSGRTGRNGGRG